MASLQANHLDVYIRGLDSAPWHRAYNGSWSSWTKIDGLQVRYDPVVVTRPQNDRTIDVFCVGYDHALYHRMWKGSSGWGAWNKIGTNCIGPPAVVSRDKNKYLELAYVGTDHALKHKRMEENQTWFPAGTETMDWGGQYIHGRGSACSWGTDHVSFFHIGFDSKCYEKKWVRGVTKAWDDFEVPGYWAAPVRSIAVDANSIKLVGLNEKSYGVIAQSSGTDKWDLEYTIPNGTFAPEIPEAASFDSKNRIDFFFLGLNSSLYQATWLKDGGYQALKFLGGNFQYAPRVVSWGPGRYDMFGIGTDCGLWHLWSNNGDAWQIGVNNFENMDGKCMGTPGGRI